MRRVVEVKRPKVVQKVTLETQIINYLKKQKKPILVSDLYATFPNYSDRNIRTIIFQLTKRGHIDDSHKCECGITRLIRLKQKVV